MCTPRWKSLVYPPIPFEEVRAERWTAEGRFMSVLLVLSVFGAIPIAFIGVWPRFDAGKGTRVQRVWTNLWLVMDVSCGPWLDILKEIFYMRKRYFLKLSCGHMCSGGIPPLLAPYRPSVASLSLLRCCEPTERAFRFQE